MQIRHYVHPMLLLTLLRGSLAGDRSALLVS